MSVKVASPKLSQLNAHPSDVVPIQRDVAVAVTTIQLSTDTASSGSNLTQPCDVVSTACDVVTTLCPWMPPMLITSVPLCKLITPTHMGSSPTWRPEDHSTTQLS
jgi:hypothetical protein